MSPCRDLALSLGRLSSLRQVGVWLGSGPCGCPWGSASGRSQRGGSPGPVSTVGVGLWQEGRARGGLPSASPQGGLCGHVYSGRWGWDLQWAQGPGRGECLTPGQRVVGRSRRQVGGDLGLWDVVRAHLCGAQTSGGATVRVGQSSASREVSDSAWSLGT